jgi:RNA polymerase sigma-70 factor, ECF subfamily
MRAKYVALDRRRHLLRRFGGAAHGSAGSANARGVEVESLATAASTSSGESPEGILEAQEQHERLRLALELLPELDRLLVYLRYFHLATTEEIEARTGLTRRAIDTRLWRARRTLREELEVLEERNHGRVRAF